jgi:hypothetical protein
MLGARLRRFSLEVHEGRGFIVVCGLDRSRYSVEDNVINLLGISSYIGAKRGMQDDDGFMLGLSPRPTISWHPSMRV